LKKRPLVKVVTATEAKNRFRELIEGAYLREEHLIVKRGGIPVVAIVPMADYERPARPEDLPAEVAGEVNSSIKEVRARVRLVTFLDQALEELPEVPEDEAGRDIEEAARATRTGT